MANVPFQEWIDAIANGKMNTNLDRTFKLEEAGKAHEYMEANKVSTSSFGSPSKICRFFIFMLFLCCAGAQLLFQADRFRRAERWYSWFRKDNGNFEELFHGKVL